MQEKRNAIVYTFFHHIFAYSFKCRGSLWRGSLWRWLWCAHAVVAMVCYGAFSYDTYTDCSVYGVVITQWLMAWFIMQWTMVWLWCTGKNSGLVVTFKSFFSLLLLFLLHLLVAYPFFFPCSASSFSFSCFLRFPFFTFLSLFSYFFLAFHLLHNLFSLLFLFFLLFSPSVSSVFSFYFLPPMSPFISPFIWSFLCYNANIWLI